MSIEEIPSDELVVMTGFWHKAFNSAGCDPMCHGCYKKIKVGGKFKLATVETFLKSDSVNNDVQRGIETREVMLCDSCTPAKVKNRAKILNDKYKKRRANGGGCYRINGKIIH